MIALRDQLGRNSVVTQRFLAQASQTQKVVLLALLVAPEFSSRDAIARACSTAKDSANREAGHFDEWFGRILNAQAVRLPLLLEGLSAAVPLDLTLGSFPPKSSFLAVALRRSLVPPQPRASNDEVSALVAYTTQNYQNINDYLRGRGRPSRLQQVKSWVESLDHLELQVPPFAQPLQVFRGSNWKLDPEQKEEGGVIEEPTFLSTSLDPTIALRFTSGDTSTRIFDIIDLPENYRAIYLPGIETVINEEEEILLPRGSRFEIVNVRTLLDGTTLRHLKARPWYQKLLK